METFLEIHKKKISLVLTLIGVLLVTLSIFLISLTLNVVEEKKYISEPRAMISVSGEGSVLAIPDVAEFGFSVKHEANTVSKAQEEVAEKMEEMTSFLKGEGVEDRHIKTVGYSVYPRYEWRTYRNPEFSTDGGERVLVGYEVIHSTEVFVKEMEKVGSLVGGVGERGATNISGVRFSVEDEDDLKRESRKAAIDDAELKAKELARDLGVSIVRIVDFNEHRTAYPGFMRLDMKTEDTAFSAEPSFEPGEEEITTQVQITYEIR